MLIQGHSIKEIIRTLDATGRRILEAARVEFSSNGFYRANMDVIANNADIGKGTLYRRFVSKQVLFFVLLEWSALSFAESVGKSSQVLSVLQRMEQHVRRSRLFISENIELIRMYVHEMSRILEGCSSEEIHAWGINYHKKMNSFWVKLAQEAAAEGLLKIKEDPELVGAILGGMAHTIYGDLIISRDPVPQEEYIRREDVFLQVLANGVFEKGV